MFVRLGCAALLACASLPAIAADPEGHRAEVRYGDLDLTTAAGVKALRKRVEAAATKVCAADNSNAADRETAIRMCRKIALARTQAAVEFAQSKAQSSKQLAQNTINLSDR